MPAVAVLRAWLSYGWQINQPWWAGADDGLLIREAIGLAKPDQLTLAKRPGYVVFLRAVHWSHLPLSVVVALFWILAACMAAWMLWRLTRNPMTMLAAYLIVLWCPMGFDNDVGQRAYRGSILTPMILMLAIALVCLFWAAEWWGRLAWASMSGLSGSFIWLLKEDSLWIFPLLGAGVIATVARLLTRRQLTVLTVLTILPALLLPALGDSVVRWRNQRDYGVSLLDTRTEGQLAGFAQRVYRIKTPDHSYRLWAPDTAINLAIDNTTDLEPLRTYLLHGMYRDGYETNGIRGDYLTWQLRYAIQEAYGEWPPEENLQRMFTKANMQLDESVQRGRIAYDTRWSPSPLASPLDWADIIRRVMPQTGRAMLQTVWPYQWRAPQAESRQPASQYEHDLHDQFLDYLNETERPVRHAIVARWLVRAWKAGMVALAVWMLAAIALAVVRRRSLVLIGVGVVLYGALYAFFAAWFLVFLNGDGMWMYVVANIMPLTVVGVLTVIGFAMAKPAPTPPRRVRKVGRHSAKAALRDELESVR